LHDPKKLASMGVEFGVGFIPFGGFAWSGYKVLTRDDASPVLAAAALVLAKDSDPKSGEALASAAKLQEKWLVRAAAFDAIAKRGDPSLLPTAIDGLQDPQDEVEYSAARAILRLSDIKGRRTERPKPQAAKSKTTSKKSP
jgi:HEAT repeat protein